jgi:hypothetical protein
MEAKVFSEEARDAIQGQSGDLFACIVREFIAANPDDDIDENDSDPYSFVPGLLMNFSMPWCVRALYGLFLCKLPEFVDVNGKHVRILLPQDHELVQKRSTAIRCFNLLFGGLAGWESHLAKYVSAGGDQMSLDLLAIAWLDGDWSNPAFHNECRRVPNFERQLAAVTYDEYGTGPSSEDMLYLAGYQQFRARYAAAGGDPKELDSQMRGFVEGERMEGKVDDKRGTDDVSVKFTLVSEQTQSKLDNQHATYVVPVKLMLEGSRMESNVHRKPPVVRIWTDWKTFKREVLVPDRKWYVLTCSFIGFSTLIAGLQGFLIATAVWFGMNAILYVLCILKFVLTRR